MKISQIDRSKVTVEKSKETGARISQNLSPSDSPAKISRADFERRVSNVLGQKDVFGSAVRKMIKSS